MAKPQEISAAALLVSKHCQRIGRRWDAQGIYAAVRGAIEDDGWDPYLVVAAGCAAANDPAIKTPAAIRWASSYPDPLSGQPSLGPSVQLCEVCGLAEPVCRQRAARTGDHHRFVPIATRHHPPVAS